jgi:hypothetical protein
MTLSEGLALTPQFTNKLRVEEWAPWRGVVAFCRGHAACVSRRHCWEVTASCVPPPPARPPSYASLLPLPLLAFPPLPPSPLLSLSLSLSLSLCLFLRLCTSVRKTVLVSFPATRCFVNLICNRIPLGWQPDDNRQKEEDGYVFVRNASFTSD